MFPSQIMGSIMMQLAALVLVFALLTTNLVSAWYDNSADQGFYGSGNNNNNDNNNGWNNGNGGSAAQPDPAKAAAASLMAPMFAGGQASLSGEWDGD